MKLILVTTIVLTLTACARLDYVQFSDMDLSQGQVRGVSVEVTEGGIDLPELTDIGADVVSSESASEELKVISTILSLVNMGPRTGNPVYDDAFAQQLLFQLKEQCEEGVLTSIRSIREAKSFGAISKEVIRIDADCIVKTKGEV